MNHFINEHGFKKIPTLPQNDINNKRPHPSTKKIMTEKSYLDSVDKNAEIWWYDHQFYWIDMRNLHFLHKNSKGTRSLRMYYHE